MLQVSSTCIWFWWALAEASLPLEAAAAEETEEERDSRDKSCERK
jgi:hypothetical protein